MNKRLLFLSVIFALLIVTQPASAAKKRAAPVSFWGSYGLRGTTPIDGKVYLSTLLYDDVREGFYSVSGNTFTGAAPALTRISGDCNFDKDTPAMLARLEVDGKYARLLFQRQEGQLVAPFSMTVYGQVFSISVNAWSVMGCNILFEVVG